MARKAGVISIDINAGTAKMVLDLENAKGKLREFGASGRSAMAPTTVALRELEGNLANNTRGVARFLAQTLHLGPVLSAAFPVIGGIAFAGMVVELGNKVADFFKKVQQGPEKMADAFRGVNGPLRQTNDELRVTNARLDVDIAKLEHKPQNTLALALAEAKAAADKLGESLEKTLKDIDRVFKEQNIGWTDKIFAGTAGTSDLQEMNTRLRHSIGAVEDNDAISATEKRTRVTNLLNAALKELHDREGLASISLPSVAGAAIGLSGLKLEDQGARLEAIRAMRQSYSGELEHVGLEGSNEAKIAQKEALEANAEAARKYREELKRLQEELDKVNEAKLSGLARVGEEERAETYRLQQNSQLNAKTAAIVREIYDTKRIDVYVETINKLGHETGEARKEWERLSVESHKAIGAEFAKEIEAGTKALEEHAKEVTKLAEEYQKLTQEAGAQSLQHRVAMVTAGGDHGNPLGVLAQQQAMQRQDIEDRYENSLKLAKDTLTGADLLLAKANLLKERGIELTQLQNQLEEKTAEIRQKGVKDFFQDMQGRAQTAGNIFYESMHQGLDRVSDEFAKFLTGQKTSFGKMFQSLGEEMLKNSIKSGLQRGLGELGKVFGVHGQSADNWASNPHHVIVDNMTGTGVAVGSPEAGLPSAASALSNGGLSGAVSGAVSGLGGFLKGLFASGGTSVTSSFIPAMAGGGTLDTGQSAWVGDGGEPELFTAGTPGTVTPAHKLSGDNHYYTIDARGAALGSEARIARAIDMAHKSAVSTGVQASAERAKRTPGGK